MVELCVGSEDGRWEEGAEGPLVLMFTDGGSGFGVEETDDAEKKVKRTHNGLQASYLTKTIF